MDKAQFLREQSDDAKVAMRNALKDARNDILHSVDPRIWAKSHPWKTVATAAAAGFAAGNALAKPSEEPGERPPTEPSKAGRLIVRIVKRALRASIAAARPFLEGLMAAHAASGNGAYDSPSTSPEPPQPQNPTNTASPNRS